VHPTGGSRRVFGQFAWLEVDSAKMAFPRPAHPRVTHTVGRLTELKWKDDCMQSLIDQILQWPAIIQGVIGSAIFWLLETLFVSIGKFVLRQSDQYNRAFAKETLIREWIYRKYYSRNGLINITQGFIITFDHIFQYLIRGLIFIVFAFLISGVSQIALGISLVAALYYLLKSLLWISPPRNWSGDSNLKHWQRVAEIEEILMGKVDSDTQERIVQFTADDADTKKTS
jgi:hypothetical protein